MTGRSEDKYPLNTKKGADAPSTATCVAVDAGICGFACRIKAWKIDKKTVGLEISQSECQQIQQFAALLKQLTLNELFMPVTRNPVFVAAEQSGCHPSCPVPAAALKAAEVALEMALPLAASIRFEPCKGEVV